MKCVQAVDLVSDYLDGRLAGDTIRVFEAHVRECDECRRTLKDMQGMLAALSTLPGKGDPPGLLARGARTDRE